MKFNVEVSDIETAEALAEEHTVRAHYESEEERHDRQRSDAFRTLKEQAFQLGFDEYQAGVPSGTKSEKLTAILDSDFRLRVTAQDRHALIRAWRHGLKAKKNGTPITTREERDAAEKEKQESYQAPAVFVTFSMSADEEDYLEDDDDEA